MNRKAQFMGQVRSVLIAIGAYLVATGKSDEATVQQMIGGITAAIGVIWSWNAPEKKSGGEEK